MNVRDWECHHVASQWSADACDGCKYEMDCYRHFLKCMTIKEVTK